MLQYDYNLFINSLQRRYRTNISESALHTKYPQKKIIFIVLFIIKRRTLPKRYHKYKLHTQMETVYIQELCTSYKNLCSFSKK